MADPTLVAAQKLRAYEEKHPFQAIAGGFTPGIGQLSAAAALRDPNAPWWEKALNAPGLIPGAAGVSKAIVIGAKLAKGNDALEGSLKTAKALAAKMRSGAESADPSKGPRGIKDLVQGDPRVNDHIAKETGWWIDPDTGKWMHEIDDSMSSPDYEFLDQAVNNKMLGDPDQTVSLADSLMHQKLKNLPEGRKMMEQVGFGFEPGYGARGGVYRPATDTIIAGQLPSPDPRAMRNLRATQLHEVGHAAAEREGFMKGTSPEAAGSMKAYIADPGEMLSRTTELRRNMTPEARRKYPFHRQMEEERARVMDPLQAERYADEKDLKRALMLRNLDPEEMLVPGP